MNEFKRMVIKVSDVTTEVATIPTTNDHTDGSWLATDIYVGELFLNITDDVLQTRTDAGIITLNSGGGGGSSAWGSITGTLSNQTDLQNALNLKVNNSDYTPAHSLLVQQSGTGSPTSLSVGNETLIGRQSGGGSQIDDLSVSDVKTMLLIDNVDNTSDLNKPVSTAQQTEIDTKQDTLVSGTNIKSINGSTVLGSGNLVINTSDAWGDITGTLSDQTDLQNALDDKQNILVSGTNIKTINGNTVLGSGDLVIDTSDAWGDITGTLSDQTDLNTALDNTTLISTLTVGTSRSLLITDRNKNIENDNSITITVPLNSSVAFTIGTQIFFTKKFETLTIAGAGGVTVNSVDDLSELGRLNCGASLLKVDTDEWNLIGELV